MLGHLSSVKHNKLLDRELRLKTQLNKVYAQRAGMTYGDHGWVWCACGRQVYPEAPESYCCPDCLRKAP